MPDRPPAGMECAGAYPVDDISFAGDGTSRSPWAADAIAVANGVEHVLIVEAALAESWVPAARLLAPLRARSELDA